MSSAGAMTHSTHSLEAMFLLLSQTTMK